MFVYVVPYSHKRTIYIYFALASASAFFLASACFALASASDSVTSLIVTSSQTNFLSFSFRTLDMVYSV